MEKIKELINKFKQMKKSQLAIIGVVVLAAIIGAIVLIATTCGKGNGGAQGGEQATTGGSVNVGKSITYTVNLKTVGGMVMSDIDVYVYADDTLADLVSFASTDENGSVSFSLPEKEGYAIAISGMPKGYDVQASYPFNGTTADITLTSSVITDGDISSATLGVGDVMYDFTITTPDGESYTLSELLSEKKMVMLNFWYTSCSWCVTEFPIMAEAYEQYKDKIEILALNPLGEGSAAVKTFAEQNALPFPTAECPTSWANVFGITGYPTSVIIDQYGVICVVEPGAITSLRPFVSAFEHFTADDYQQKLCTTGIGDLVTNVKPTYTMDTTENISAAINNGDITITYRPEEDEEDAEYAWPFIIGEKDGENCIYASNQKIEGSYAIIYADVDLKAGQAIGFDYFSSTEKNSDVLFVIVNDEDIYQISGVSDNWMTCYPWVAEEDGTYELALCYVKDEDTNEGDDTVYIKNMRVVSESDINEDTYMPREAATTEDGFEYTYVDIVFNEKDGYYHVGTVDGPLLLADLMNYTQFNEESTVFDMISGGDVEVDGVNLYDALIDYCSYASNSNLTGVCTVTYELAEGLKLLASVEGFEDNENEWLKLCRYYKAYGTDGKQLEDPIKGLAPFSAYKAQLGTNIESNFFYYNRAIIPRGTFAEFIPTVSGVYRITSKTDTADGVNAWIFDANKKELLVYEHCERMYEDTLNCSMLYYMEAGTPYYINIAFWDVYGTGYINYDIEYVGSNMQLFRTCAPGYFTYDSNATGDEMYYVISGGIDVVLGTDGKYYEDKGKDSNGNQIYGSLIYADFTGTTGIFDKSIEKMIEMGAFDFSKTENDDYVLTHLKNNNNDVEATKTYFKELWGEEYDGYAAEYQLEDVLAGIYHGEGEDYTDEMKTYLSKYDASGLKEREGCVVVDEELAEMLQMLMSKYTFENVDDAWAKLCYYYDDLKENVQ